MLFDISGDNDLVSVSSTCNVTSVIIFSVDPSRNNDGEVVKLVYLKKASSPPLSAPAVAKKPEAKPESSSSDDGSDSGSGVADVNVKPLTSKPMVVASKAKKSISDSKAGAVVPTKSAVKHQVENNGEEKNSKRAKKKVEEAEIEEKKSGSGDSKKII